MRLQPTLPSALVALAGCATDNSRTSQLCSVDTITIIQPGGRPDPRCGSGRFQPMVPAPVKPTP